MADIDLQRRAIDALIRIQAFIISMQSDTSADSTIIDSIEMLYLHLLETVRQDAPSVFAELEKKLPSCEDISNKQVDETIQMSSLLDILHALCIKNISFNKDPENEELQIFINLFAEKPKPIQDEVTLQEPVMESAAAQVEPVVEPVKEEPAPEKEQEVVPDLEIAKSAAAQVEPVKEEPTPEKEQEVVPDLEIAKSAATQVEPVKEEPAPEKEQEVVPDLEIAKSAATQVEPDKKETALEKEQKIVSESAVAEGQISGNISELEKVFTRLNAMNGDLASLPSEEKMAEIIKLVAQVAEWLEKEETFTPEYKKLCERLETLLQDFIVHGYFAEAGTIINVFSKINNGTLKRDDKVRDVSLKIIKNLATDHNFNILFKEINTNERNKQNEACKIFAGFGNVVINKLLDGLKRATDSKARISILHVVEEMGDAAIPAVKATIDMSAPWYYLRNMAYLLGRIGNEKNIDVFEPLLLHKEKRVRMEAFKSIVQTGGNKRGALFLSILPQVDKELRINIIEMLGKIKYAEAVTDLQFMLKSKYSTLAKNDQIYLQEEICSALGAIGSPEAVKVLSEVAESKSILGIGTFSKEVKYAAERALSYIRKRDQTK